MSGLFNALIGDNNTLAGANAVVLNVILMESNSGGEGAFVSSLTALEKAERPLVQHWHNTANEFQNLHMGANNLIDHFGLADNTRYCVEATIADRMEAGTFVTSCYTLKRGQGGSTIAQWAPAGTYYNKFVNSMNAAISAIHDVEGVFPTIHCFWTHGINDMIIGTDPTVYKTAVLAFMDDMRIRYGNIKFHMTKLMPLYDAWNTPIVEIASSRTGIYLLDGTSEPLYNSEHWNETGIYNLGTKYVDSVLAHL